MARGAGLGPGRAATCRRSPVWGAGRGFPGLGFPAGLSAPCCLGSAHPACLRTPGRCPDRPQAPPAATRLSGSRWGRRLIAETPQLARLARLLLAGVAFEGPEADSHPGASGGHEGRPHLVSPSPCLSHQCHLLQPQSPLSRGLSSPTVATRVKGHTISGGAACQPSDCRLGPRPPWPCLPIERDPW